MAAELFSMAGSVCGREFTEARPVTGAEGNSATPVTPVTVCLFVRDIGEGISLITLLSTKPSSALTEGHTHVCTTMANVKKTNAITIKRPYPFHISI
jgi:hypothetical protein